MTTEINSKQILQKNALGIIAGGGNLPIELANIYFEYDKNIRIASISPENYNILSGKFDCHKFEIGQVGAIIEYFRKSGVTQVMMIGNIARPDLKSIKVDFQGSKLLAKILKTIITAKNTSLGDDKLLTIVSEFLEKNGFKIISPLEILQMANYNLDSIKTNLPTLEDQIDISIGRNILLTMGNLDVGQSVIVHNRYVLGIEAAEGTDNLIKRCALLRKTKKGGVLVKMSKTKQDLRFDLPTIGPNTVSNLIEYGFSGVAIEQPKVLVTEVEKTKALASENGIFITSTEE